MSTKLSPDQIKQAFAIDGESLLKAFHFEYEKALLVRKQPISVPADGDWYVRLVISRGRIVFGIYRRHLKTIGYLGQIDKIFGIPVTTRNWKTMMTIVQILKGSRDEIS